MPNPGSLGSVAPRGHDWLVREVNALKKQLNQLMTARTLESAVIGKGGITIKGGALRLLDAVTSAVLVVLDSLGLHVNAGGKIDVNDGGLIELNDGSTLNINDGGGMFLRSPGGVGVFQAYRTDIPDGSGRKQQTFAIFRDDGTPVFIMADLGTVPGHAHHQAFIINDRVSSVLIADDTVSGQGLAWPLLPLGDWISNSYPTDTTNSGTFQTLNTLTGFKQQPRVLIQILARMDDPGTAGEIRVTDQAGNVVGGVTTVAAGSYVSFYIGPVALAGTHGQPIGLNLQGRVTSGPGTIGARGQAAWGQPS